MMSDMAAQVTALVLATFRANGALIAAGDMLTAPFGLSSARWQVLGAVALAGQALTVPQVARNMGLTRQSVQRLVDEFRMTHEQAADAVGRSRTATTNLLRLLKLTKPVQAMVMEGVLEMGHARAVLALEGARQIEAANRIAARGLSVREAEALVAKLLRAQGARRSPKTDRDLERLEEEVSERLGTTVKIRARRKGGGKLIVHYASLDHLDQLLKKLS